MELLRMLVSVGLIGLFVIETSATNPDVSTIFFRHYSRDSYIDINIANVSALIPYVKLSDCPTVYFHGYTESVNSESVRTVVGAYLNYTTTNIFAIDYSKLVNKDYVTSLANVNAIAKAISDTLNTVYNVSAEQMECMHFVCHSLGGLVCSRVTKGLLFRVRRVSGLDPAGPLIFKNFLTARDADFVDVIHTDAGAYGLIFDSGDVNFKPNFGHRLQPGCPLITIPLTDSDYCSHHRSWLFWAESIKNEMGFLAVKCSNDLRFALGLCNNTDIIPMGIATPRNATGVYYLHTNAQSPFARGIQGVEKNLSTVLE